MAPDANATELRVVEARKAHDRGWLLTPLRGKRPYLKHWSKLAAPEHATVERWARAGNVGLRTGSASGIVVIDDDTPDGSGTAKLNLPPTPTVITGSGKRHLYFKRPAGGLKNSVGNLADHVDVRGDRGQVVFVGSIHPATQRPYEWEAGRSPDEIPLAEIPDSVLRLLDARTLRQPSTTASARRPSQRDVGRLQRYATRALLQAADRIATTAEGQRNVTLNREAFALARYVGAGLLSRSDVEQRLIAGGMRSGLSEDETRKTLKSAIDAGILKPAPLPELLGNLSLSTPVQGADSDRPIILVEGGRLAEIVDQAEQALLADSGTPVFQYSGRPVRVVRVKDGESATRPSSHSGGLLLRAIDVPYLRERFTKAARFETLRGSGVEVIDAPEKVAVTYLAREGLWKLPTLRGVIEAPTLRPDGSIVEQPGYDGATGLFLDPGNSCFPPVPVTPSQADAVEALAPLHDLLKGFPWVADCDRAAALSAILTALVRRSLHTAPLFAFRAPKMGSGKSLLVDVVALIVTGRAAPVMSVGKEEDEDRKLLVAALLAGTSLICLDNVGRELGGDALCSMLTQSVYETRLLMTLKNARVSTAATFFATGNNLTFRGDLTTRVIPVDLDPNCERPEERKFDVNLHEYIPQHRGELVRAALTVLRAYHVAGRPRQALPVFGRFEMWSDLVRSALVWVGEADPCAGRLRIRDTDPERELVASVLTRWFALFGNQPLTAVDVIRDADPRKTDPNSLWDDLCTIAAGRDGSPDSRRLGQWLKKFHLRIEQGLRVERAGERQGSVLWRVVKFAGSSVTSVTSVTSVSSLDLAPARDAAPLSTCGAEQASCDPASSGEAELSDTNSRKSPNSPLEDAVVPEAPGAGDQSPKAADRSPLRHPSGEPEVKPGEDAT